MSDTQHTPSELSERPAEERAERYRKLADMHLRLGRKTAIADARASHLELAALWTRLAAQATHQADIEALEEEAKSASGPAGL